MVGQFGVGKTSLVRRFVFSLYDDHYLTTIGAKVDRKDVVAGSTPVTMMLWDIAGEDDLAPFKISHLRGASGYILVADGCRAESLAKAVELQQRITEEFGELPCVLVLNKFDLCEQWEIDRTAAAQHGCPVFETSAKTGSGVEEMFLRLAQMLVDRHASETERQASEAQPE
jgi:small GTP-binding protein